jgi:adenylate cyclase
MPTVALALHIDSMGSVAALGFVAPMIYFIFIILSTLAPRFLALHLHRRRRRHAAVLHGDVLSSGGRCRPRHLLSRRPQPDRAGLRRARRRGRAPVAAAVRASIKAATARDRITNLFGQHVSPQVVERLMAEGTRTDSDIRRVAVMFVDFRSFTAGARTRTPQEGGGPA